MNFQVYDEYDLDTIKWKEQKKNLTMISYLNESIIYDDDGEKSFLIC